MGLRILSMWSFLIHVYVIVFQSLSLVTVSESSGMRIPFLGPTTAIKSLFHSNNNRPNPLFNLKFLFSVNKNETRIVRPYNTTFFLNTLSDKNGPDNTFPGTNKNNLVPKHPVVTTTTTTTKRNITMSSSSEINYALLCQQNAATSNAIIDYYSNSSEFAKLAKVEGDAILQRDREDGEKLQVGIDYAKSKGVIDPNYVPEPYVEIDVLGKTPDQVCDEILVHVNQQKSDSGSVIVLCGLSGTGKGTTVAKLREKIGQTQEVVCWSNGNIFRSVTLLAATWCEQQLAEGTFDASKALTKENLASFVSMLSFGKREDGKYDTRINGLGLDLWVSEVQNTLLKVPKVSKNIPTVAEKTQGEVILFAADAIAEMSSNGITILLEGREQTVNYVRTPLRFTLTLSDDTLIGRRRAAQRLMAAALKTLPQDCDEGTIQAALDTELAKMVKEI